MDALPLAPIGTDEWKSIAIFFALLIGMRVINALIPPGSKFKWSARFFVEVPKDAPKRKRRRRIRRRKKPPDQGDT